MTTSILLAILAVGSFFKMDVGPQVVPISVDTPLVWNASSADISPQTAWWLSFGEPSLDACVNEALTRNRDIDAAMARVQQARMMLKETAGAQAVTLDAKVDVSRGQALSQFNASQNPVDINQIYGAVNYEADLWGRLSKATAAARRDLLATEATRDSVRLSIAGNVALAYFNLRGADLQLQVARNTLASRQESLALQRIRYESGMVSELDIRREEAELATAAVMVQNLEDSINRYESALLVLMGRTPKDLMDTSPPRGVSLDVLPKPPAVPAGLPSQLLGRRPDVRASEQSYLAAMDRVGVANAARYPSLSLTGLLGSYNNNLDSMFTGPTGWGLAAGLVAPLLDGNKRASRLERAKATAWEAAASYERTAQTAFQETKDALVTREKSEQVLTLLTEKEVAQKRAAELAQILYEGGRSSLLELLDARRQLLAVQIDLEGARRDRLNSVVHLFMALGGGWDAPISGDTAALLKTP